MSNPPSAQPHPSQRAHCRLNQMYYAVHLAALFSLSSYVSSNFSGLELNGGSHQLTLLEIFLQLSDEGFFWRINLALLALERQWVP